MLNSSLESMSCAGGVLKPAVDSLTGLADCVRGDTVKGLGFLWGLELRLR